MPTRASLAGFTFSFFCHAGLILAAFWLVQTPQQSTGTRPLNISIGAFRTPESSAQNSPEPATTSAPQTTPESNLETSVDASDLAVEEVDVEPVVEAVSGPKAEAAEPAEPADTADTASSLPAAEPLNEQTIESNTELASELPTVTPDEPVIETTREPTPEAPSQTEADKSPIATSELTPEKATQPDTVQVKQVEAGPAAQPVDQNFNIANDEVLKIYQTSVRRRVEEAKFYPRKAKRLRREGAVRIEFAIVRNGQIIEPQISKSSNHPELDRAALEAVKAASPFPPLPEKFPEDLWRFDLTLIYELN